MKKKVLLVSMLSIFLVTSMVFASGNKLNDAYAKNYVYLVNGKQMPLPDGLKTIEYNNRAYVPVRFVSEVLGVNVLYDQKGMAISLKNTFVPAGTDFECPIITPNDKIRDLEKKLEELKKENASLKSKVSKLDSSILNDAKKFGYENAKNYAKLPTYVADDNVEIRIKNVGVDDRGMFVNVRVTNINDQGDKFALYPSKAVLLSDGKEYSGTTDSGTTLYNTLNEKDEKLDGVIYFDDVTKNDKGLYTIKFDYTDVSGTNHMENYINFEYK